FAQARSVPPLCRTCRHVETCGGGGSGRRGLLRALGQPDPYCPVVRGGDRKLEGQMATSPELPKLGSACTTILMALGRNTGCFVPNSRNSPRRRVLTIATLMAAPPAIAVLGPTVSIPAIQGDAGLSPSRGSASRMLPCRPRWYSSWWTFLPACGHLGTRTG